jgi:hypothetical protein
MWPDARGMAGEGVTEGDIQRFDGGSSFSVGGAAVATEAYAVCARRTERRDVHVAEADSEALGGAAKGSYEQEAAAVEEDEEMRDGTRG